MIFRLQARRPTLALIPSSVLLLLLHLPTSGAAQTWLPLQTGFVWNYVGTSGGGEARTVEGVVTVLGRSVSSILYQPSSFGNDGLRNYWTTGPDGDVLIHGFLLPKGSGYAYDPPIVVLDAPLFVGKTWQQSVDVYSLPGEAYAFSFDIAFEVYEEGPVQVPAGEFLTFGLGQAIPQGLTPVPASFHLDGTRASEMTGETATDYWAMNVGIVRQILGVTLELVSYGYPTAVKETSWTAIKALYQ